MTKPAVAVFDDDIDILTIVEVLLEGAGWQVFTFSNVDDVLLKIAACKPNLIIMDNWIPEVGGIEATHKIKASEFSTVPVIYFTANIDADKLARDAGADDLIEKPFDIDELLTVVERVVRTKD